MLKILANLSRFVVGILFVFSGFVKIVDPVGTALKLEEYFYVFSDRFAGFFEAFVPYTLFFSVLFTTLEIVLGVALLLLFRIRTTIWSLVILILFFTWLTGFSALTGEVTDCGCFGDAIPLDPMQSFIKDLILCVLIAFLFLYRKKFTTVFDNVKGVALVGLSTAFCLVFAWYNLAHLPSIDFRPYKIGNDIKALSNDADPGVVEYTMEKDGKTYTFNEYPKEPGYTYMSFEQIEEPGLSTIHDFFLFDEAGEDQTATVLEGGVLLMVFQHLEEISDADLQQSLGLLKKMSAPVHTAIVFGGDYEALNARLSAMNESTKFNAYSLDEKVIKAMIRANPGFVTINDGVIQGKWHFNDIPSSSEVAAQLK